MEIGIDGRPSHHWTRENSKGESGIDRTLADLPIIMWTILADDHATGSKHEVIEREVRVDRQEEVDHERIVGWHLASMTEKEAKVAEKLWIEQVKERAQLDAECTDGAVEQEAAWFQKAMSSIFDATVKKIRICARSGSWSNPDIKEWRQTVGREKRRRRNSERASRATAELQKSIRQSK